VNLAERI